ncbi:nitric oxide associated protein 1 [Dispira parvispora]|uniref:Nitric oxide associated protein 1 n=1 Tax=Dispira parvispora TaxID=1520584 RepID=A0A9W8AVZ8_9FUNG|nr:nitric oxide associated protein 1 [Dispira parvispora]
MAPFPHLPLQLVRHGLCASVRRRPLVSWSHRSITARPTSVQGATTLPLSPVGALRIARLVSTSSCCHQTSDLDSTSAQEETKYITPPSEHCPGCGAKFHRDDPKQPGFLPRIKVDKNSPSVDYITKKNRSGANILSETEYQQRLETLDESLKPYFVIESDPSDVNSVESAGEKSSSANESPATSSALASPSADEASRRVVCQRCHNMLHYNKFPMIWHNSVAKDPEILGFMRDKPSALVLHVFDVFDLPNSLLKGLSNYIGKQHDVILVANKMDVLPKDVHLNRLATYIQRMIVNTGILNVIALHLVSARKVHGVRELCADLMTLRKTPRYRHCDIYMVGRANVGKSELVNAMLRISYGGSPHKVTTFPIPGTTCDTLKIPLERFKKALVDPQVADAAHLYDTPGIFNDHNLTKYLFPSELRQCLPKSNLQPSTYGVKLGQSICLGGLGRLDVVDGPDRLLITVFSSIPVHVTKTEKAERMCDAMQQGQSTALQPPKMNEQRAAVFPRMQLVDTFTLHNDHSTMACRDVVFSGLGWFAISGKFDQATIKVYSAGGSGVHLRTPMLPFEYKRRLTKYRSNMRKQP